MSRSIKRSSAAVAMASLLLAVSAVSVPGHAQSVSEDSVKAAFLYRFADYVDWPPPALNSAQFTIAVLDDERVAADLGQILASHELKGHPAQVKLIHRAAEVADAQMVFVGSGDPAAHRRFIKGLAGHPVLIVTDEEGGLEEGSSVNFMLVDHRLRFEISLTAAERSGLKISSELLSVAARVEGRLRSHATCTPTRPGETGGNHCPVTVATQ